MGADHFGVEDIHHGISSVAIDKDNNVWVLESESPSVIIYDGKEIEPCNLLLFS